MYGSNAVYVYKQQEHSVKKLLEYTHPTTPYEQLLFKKRLLTIMHTVLCVSYLLYLYSIIIYLLCMYYVFIIMYTVFFCMPGEGTRSHYRWL